jgi:hypothetical protein
MKKLTNKELKEISNTDLILLLIQDRKQKVTNVYSVWHERLERLQNWVKENKE